jgi:hypothetical protein
MTKVCIDKLVKVARLHNKRRRHAIAIIAQRTKYFYGYVKLFLNEKEWKVINKDIGDGTEHVIPRFAEPKLSLMTCMMWKSLN